MSEEYVDWENFYEEQPEDLFASEEMYYGYMAKCRGGGRAKKRDKFRIKVVPRFHDNACIDGD